MRKILLLTIALSFILSIGYCQEQTLTENTRPDSLIARAKKFIGKERLRVIPDKFVITGMVWNANIPGAIINGAVVSEGHIIGKVKSRTSVQPLRIVTVQREGVSVAYGDQILVISMRNPETKEYSKYTSIHFNIYGEYVVKHKRDKKSLVQRIREAFVKKP